MGDLLHIVQPLTFVKLPAPEAIWRPHAGRRARIAVDDPAPGVGDRLCHGIDDAG